ncbi:hypothetical protein [Sinomonas sp. G460-2]|uniref:hypothetical protein n=1 Tax=Sinomonas sp. G460-2 TaxID=3393464 RepID=UPI0039F05B20
MNDGLLVTNLVYTGTLVIGGLLLLIVIVSLVGTMLVAGVAQLAISIAKLTVKLGAKVFVYRPETVEAQSSASEHVRNAVVAKADAILAAAKTEAAEVAASAKSSEAASAAAKRLREAAKSESEKAPAARAKAATDKATLTLAYSDRTGPFTGTQPLVKAG